AKDDDFIACERIRSCGARDLPQKRPRPKSQRLFSARSASQQHFAESRGISGNSGAAFWLKSQSGMLTTRIAGTAAVFIVSVCFADGASAQTTTTATSAKSANADGAAPGPTTSSRPIALTSLYGTFIALQGLDVDSTLKGIRSGKTIEVNPIMGTMASTPPMLIAFKAGTTAAIIALCEQMRKDHHGTAAVFVMI